MSRAYKKFQIWLLEVRLLNSRSISWSVKHLQFPSGLIFRVWITFINMVKYGLKSQILKKLLLVYSLSCLFPFLPFSLPSFPAHTHIHMYMQGFKSQVTVPVWPSTLSNTANYVYDRLTQILLEWDSNWKKIE